MSENAGSCSVSNKTIRAIDEIIIPKAYSSVFTQCGSCLTAEEENIVVMVKSFSPVRDIDFDEGKQVRVLFFYSSFII